MEVVAYFRVSTKGQVESGLGLDAQREYVKITAKQQGWKVVAEYEDVGVSGSPPSPCSTQRASKDGRIVVVAKLDRLSRDVKHIAGLMKAKSRL
ncbi:hypothetical protein D3C73_1022730 [compost metagenome]